ncbi:MAG: DUF2066 domain-containing protein [Gammaproteobacteria bacterium]
MPTHALARFAMMLLIPLFAPMTQAVQVEGLYEASVPVDSQAVAERERALRVGLGQVLARVTGAVDADSRERLREVVANASTALQQYRYDVRRDGPDAGKIFLWMLFDAGNVERMLIEQGIPVWGNERPETLLWVAIDDGQRRLLSADVESDIRDAVSAASAANGLPLILPLMDLEDRAAIGFTEVWGDFRDRIDSASQRYGARSVLLGRLSRSGSGWQARWTHILPDGDASSAENSASSFQAVNAGVALALRRLAERFASAAGDASGTQVVLTVDGVGSLEDYASVTRYLSRMPLVVRWFLNRAKGESLAFDVELKASVEAFRRAAELDSVLVGSAGDTGGGLVYRLAQ